MSAISLHESVVSSPTPAPSAAVSVSWLRRVLMHRLTHFVAIGAAAFALAPPIDDGRTVHISADEATSVWAMRARHGVSKELSQKEKREALAQYIEDELYYREGLRLGLDKGDGIVRNRVVQKMMFYAEDLGGVSAPTTDEALRTYFEAHRAVYVREQEIKFAHVFVSNVAHPNDGPKVASSYRDRLLVDGSVEPKSLGDAFATTRLKEWNTPSDLVQDFGESAVGQMTQSEVGKWSAPIASPFGWHLVRVTERRGGRQATFDEAKRDVVIDYQADRKRGSMDALFSRLKKEYRLDVQLSQGETFSLPERSSGRTASRGGE